MVKYKVIWEIPTRDDLAKIYWYFAKQALVPAVGARLVKKIRKAGNNLKHSPYYCPIYDEKRKLRKYVVGSYLILFIVDEEKRIVRITQVVRGNRDLPKVVR
jgi:plasmid stabilization system protein ParE